MKRPDQNRCDYCGVRFDPDDKCPSCGLIRDNNMIYRLGEARHYEKTRINESFGNEDKIINLQAETDYKYFRNECFYCNQTATQVKIVDGRKVLICDMHYSRIYTQGNIHLVKNTNKKLISQLERIK